MRHAARAQLVRPWGYSRPGATVRAVLPTDAGPARSRRQRLIQVWSFWPGARAWMYGGDGHRV